MKFFAVTTIGLIAAASASWAYAGDGLSEIGKDIASVMSSDAQTAYVAEPATSIRPGTILYTAEGERIGVIRALTLNDTEIKTVWVGAEEYSPGTVALVDGVATYFPEAQTAG